MDYLCSSASGSDILWPIGVGGVDEGGAGLVRLVEQLEQRGASAA